jgi:hypothetical protein
VSFKDFDPDKVGQKFIKTKINYVKPEQSNVYRVLPPFGSLAEQNKIAQYWVVHYGFAKSKSGKNIPVPCGQASKFENGKKVITQACSMCDKMKAMENAVEALRAANSPGHQAALLALETKLKDLSTDKKYYMNVMTREKTVEVLKIGHKQWLALEAARKRLKDEFGYNAFGITNGLFLDFRKAGKNRDTTFSVDPATITTRDSQTGTPKMEYITSNLTADDLGRIEKDAKDLTMLFRTFSLEDIALIAKGDESTIQRLFSNPVNDVEDSPEDDDSAIDAATTEALKMAGITTGLTATATTASTTTTTQSTTVSAPTTPAAATTQAPTTPVPPQSRLLTSQEIIDSFLKG